MKAAPAGLLLPLAARCIRSMQTVWGVVFPGRPAPRANAASPPALGPEEARAIERALERWVQLQKSESKIVPTRRIDSD